MNTVANSGEYGDRGIIREQATTCQLVHHPDAIVMKYFATNLGVLFGLRHANGE